MVDRYNYLKEMANKERIKIKDIFVERYKKLLGGEYDNFMKYSLSYLNKCVRINTLKVAIADVKDRLQKQGWQLTQVPWCAEGFWILGDRLDIGNLVEHQLGYLYVQEAASMIPPLALFQGEMNKDFSDEIVLDMCAAPGSKSSQIASYMKNKGILVCNDLLGSRLKALGINLQKLGVHNALITKSHGGRFRDKKFDRILVDAPCSGTGTIRKSLKVLTMYGHGLVRKLSAEQFSLLEAGYQALKKGGILVYSTCTLEPQENEAVVSRLLDKYDDIVIEPIALKINRSTPVLDFEGLKIRPEVKDCLRIYPQDNNSEGFFVCRMRKK